MVSISLFYFLTKHIAITNIKFVFTFLVVSTTLLSRSSICCAQNNKFIDYINFGTNTGYQSQISNMLDILTLNDNLVQI